MSSNQSIKLYESLKQLTKAQLSEVCFYLKNEYHYDLSHVNLDKAPSEIANQLIELIKQYPQGLSNLSKAINEVAPPNPIDEEHINVNDLRPYLINRTDQKRELLKAIKAHNKQSPFFCLIHGDEDQCHNEFFDRLVQYEMRQFRLVSDNDILYKLLSCRFYKGIDTLHQEILDNLNENLSRFYDELSEIIDAIVKEKRPILFYTTMSTDDWSQGGMKLVHEFIKFWKKCRLPANHNHFVLICLYFKYTEEPIKFFRWRKKTSINDKIRQEFQQLKLDEFGVDGIVLPELKNIKKIEVEEWVDKHLYLVSDIMQQKIDNLFKSPNETMAMLYLARKISCILKTFPLNVFRE